MCAVLTAPPPFPSSLSARRKTIASSYPPSPLRVRGGRQAPHPNPRRTAARDLRERHRTQPSPVAWPVLHSRPLFYIETPTERKRKLGEVAAVNEAKLPAPGGARAREGADPASQPTSPARPGFQYPEPTPRSSPRPFRRTRRQTNKKRICDRQALWRFTKHCKRRIERLAVLLC